MSFVQVLQNQPNLKPKQVPRARSLQAHDITDEAEGPSPSTRSLSSLLLERSLNVLLQDQNEITDGEVCEDEPDIDSADRQNPLAVVEYCPDIYTYYRRIESKTRASSGYMSSQVIIRPWCNLQLFVGCMDWLRDFLGGLGVTDTCLRVWGCITSHVQVKISVGS